jgi:hypothetical protein
MKAILEEQRDRIVKRQKETAGNLQLSLFAEGELRQLEAIVAIGRNDWNDCRRN